MSDNLSVFPAWRLTTLRLSFSSEPPSPGWGPALHDSVPSLQSALVVKMYCSLIQAPSQQEQMVGVYRDGGVTVSISGAPLASAEHVKKMKRALFSGLTSVYCVFALKGRVPAQVFAYVPITIHYYILPAHAARLTPRRTVAWTTRCAFQ